MTDFRLQELSTKTDEQLCSLYVSTGVEGCFKELHDRYCHIIFNLCYKYLQSEKDAEDVCQDIFSSLVTNLKNARIENFGGWIYTVAKHQCERYALRAENQLIAEEQYKSEKNFSEKSVEFETLMSLIDKEEENFNKKAIQEALPQLKKEYAESINLFYYKDLTYKEIALKMNTSEKSVKSYLQNGKMQLLNILSRTLKKKTT